MRKTSQNWQPSRAPERNSIGLALSAGGARGAYQIGCWRAFRERGLSFGAVAGSSIGALNGALVCQGDWQAAYDLWVELTLSNSMSLDYRKIGKLALTAATDIGLLFVPVPNLRFLRVLKYASAVIKVASRHGSLGMLKRKGMFNLQDMKPVFSKHIDMSKVLGGTIPLFVAVTGPSSQLDPVGPLRYFTLQDHGEEEAWSILAASMSIPFVFAGVPIDGDIHADGGMRESLPVDALYKVGFRKIVAVGMKSEMNWKQELYPDAAIVLINPDKNLGRFPMATFKFTERAVMAWMDRGYLDAHNVLDNQPLT